MGKVFRPRIVIPESFDLCLTYEQQILYLVRWCGMLADAIGGPGSPAIEELQEAVGKINDTLAQIELSLQDYYSKGEIDVKLSGYVTKVTLDSTLESYETVESATEAHNHLIDMINQRALKTDLDELEQTVNQAVDYEVTEGSKKPVESGAVKAYVDAEIAKLRGGN